jgi:hypothetical protein
MRATTAIKALPTRPLSFITAPPPGSLFSALKVRDKQGATPQPLVGKFDISEGQAFVCLDTTYLDSWFGCGPDDVEYRKPQPFCFPFFIIEGSYEAEYKIRTAHSDGRRNPAKWRRAMDTYAHVKLPTRDDLNMPQEFEKPELVREWETKQVFTISKTFSGSTSKSIYAGHLFSEPQHTELIDDCVTFQSLPKGLRQLIMSQQQKQQEAQSASSSGKKLQCEEIQSTKVSGPTFDPRAEVEPFHLDTQRLHFHLCRSIRKNLEREAKLRARARLLDVKTELRVMWYKDSFKIKSITPVYLPVWVTEVRFPTLHHYDAAEFAFVNGINGHTTGPRLINARGAVGLYVLMTGTATALYCLLSHYTLSATGFITLSVSGIMSYVADWIAGNGHRWRLQWKRLDDFLREKANLPPEPMPAAAYALCDTSGPYLEKLKKLTLAQVEGISSSPMEQDTLAPALTGSSADPQLRLRGLQSRYRKLRALVAADAEGSPKADPVEQAKLLAAWDKLYSKLRRRAPRTDRPEHQHRRTAEEWLWGKVSSPHDSGEKAQEGGNSASGISNRRPPTHC